MSTFCNKFFLDLPNVPAETNEVVVERIAEEEVEAVRREEATDNGRSAFDFSRLKKCSTL